MNIIDQILESKTTYSYWEKILGKDLLDDVIMHRDIFMDHLLEKEQILLDKEFCRFMCTFKVSKCDDLFGVFTERLSAYIQIQFEIAAYADTMLSHLFRDVARQLIENMKWLYLRCLIVELQRIKAEGLLHGQDSVQEYEYFLENFLENESFMKIFLEKYPVMTWLIVEKIQATSLYLREISENLVKDKEKIILQLCQGNAFDHVEAMEIGLSDEHFSGKTVVKLNLDNGYTIYYKPRSSESMIGYQEISQWLLNGCGMDAYTYPIINGKKYAWEAEVVYKECNNSEDVAEYYDRMGILLCLTYILKISDLHFENIIAHGKYPVIIDVEIFPERYCLNNANRGCLDELLSDTVLNTGILQAGDSANFDNIGALGLSGETKASYKLPTVIHSGTSKMQIDYTYFSVKPGKNLPLLNGQRIGCEKYKLQIIKGFQKAYERILQNKLMFQTLLKNHLPENGRYLRRNTQQYMMYQNLAGFPDFLKMEDARYLMLMRLKRNDTEKDYCHNKILNYERQSIFHMQIPVFYAKGKDLYMGDGIRIENYFEQNAEDLLIDRMDKLDLKDMRFQIKVIETAFLNMCSSGNVSRYVSEKENIQLTPEYIADWIIDESIDCDGQLNWIGLHSNIHGKAYLAPVDRYLYSGWSGIAIFMTAMAVEYRTERYVKLAQRLCDQLFRYTDALIGGDMEKPSQWGIYTGEASIVYTYYVLCQIVEDSSAKQKLKTYAVRHGEIILNHLDDVADADLLDGKAGVLISLLRVFEMAGENKYIEGAIYLAELLEKTAVTMPVGIGWICKGQPKPLAGMAHGNSGIALAFARLYKFTKMKHYRDIVKQCIEYEDTLYDEDCDNWLDIRNIGQGELCGRDTVAWCHGAGGILAARVELLQDAGVVTKKSILEKTVLRVARENSAKMCLCHGKTGLQLSLKHVKNHLEFNMRKCNILIDEMSVEDCLSMGIMAGMAGMGYGLIIDQDLRSWPIILLP